MKLVVASDHAVIRYLERKFAIPIEKIREEIISAAKPAALSGASNFEVGDLCFCFSHGQTDGRDSVIITTILKRGMGKAREKHRATPSAEPRKEPRPQWHPHRKKGE